ncbi:DNA-binding transcriptional LysR family regulator [Paenibacillus turicensis]|uniref:DNA-binding transcriptional LysR family regulator n=1 Tax=Paenibacillus turicensis TaxID=160487 RepID=A0ABS4FYE4_9BACL|nr:LysR family transcriptional regulator [Paenibacillus turicensis]MBP1907555.1 DNA-binding transcriptional LysR family regulator [Paenibacillus turicensis]
MSKLQSQDILYYIDTLLKYSNYSKAAKALYISQPYLTKVIKKVESELNCELITRNKLPYRLTEQGKIYYQYLTSMENNYAKLIREITYVSDMDNQVLRIGILPSLGSYLTPLFLPEFLALHPTYKINLLEDLPEKNEKLLQNNELDFWIGQNSGSISPNLNAVSWGKHSYSAIIPRCCELYQQDVAIIPEGSLDIREILGQRLILTSKGSAIRKQIDQLLSVYKIQPNILLESNDIYTVLKLAKRNLGLTIIPESIHIKECPPEYNIYPIPMDKMSLDYFIAYQSERTLTSVDHDLINAFLNHGQPCAK